VGFANTNGTIACTAGADACTGAGTIDLVPKKFFLGDSSCIALKQVFENAFIVVDCTWSQSDLYSLPPIASGPFTAMVTVKLKVTVLLLKLTD
jgi:hypothetical protein